MGIFIGIGSNLCNCFDNVCKALKLIWKRPIVNFWLSPIIETATQLSPGTPDDSGLPYHNLVIRGNTALQPFQLVEALVEVERKLGRGVWPRWWAFRFVFKVKASTISAFTMSMSIIESFRLRRR